MRAQAFSDPSRSNFMTSPKTMEINPRHPIVHELMTLAAEKPEEEHTRDVAWMLVQVKGVDFDEGGNEWVMGDSLELQVGATKDKNGHDALRSKPVSYSSSKRTQWSCSWSKCRA